MSGNWDGPMPVSAMNVIHHYLHRVDLCERIIRALPDCLTPVAVDEIKHHLGAVLRDDEALAEFCALVDR